mgnify:CR=1 FL=1
MTTYTALRHFADSYVLVGLGLLYLLLVFWAFRPGSRQKNDRAATMIFEKDDEHG